MVRFLWKVNSTDKQSTEGFVFWIYTWMKTKRVKTTPIKLNFSRNLRKTWKSYHFRLKVLFSLHNFNSYSFIISFLLWICGFDMWVEVEWEENLNISRILYFIPFHLQKYDQQKRALIKSMGYGLVILFKLWESRKQERCARRKSF